MTRKRIANFIVEGDVVVGSKSAAQLQQGAANAKHRVKVINRSTLPYDIVLKCKLPDGKPPRALSYSASPDNEWQARWNGVWTQAPEQTQRLDVHGPPASNQRLWISEVHHRLANGASGHSGSNLFVIITANPLPIDVCVDVI